MTPRKKDCHEVTQTNGGCGPQTPFACREFQVLTLNIHMLPWFTSPFNKNSSRMKLMLKELSRFDIVCLQELFASQQRAQVQEWASKNGYHCYMGGSKWYQISSWTAPLNNGLCILSRFPIVERDYFVYDHALTVDRLSRKGALYCKVQVGDSYLHIFNTHLQAEYQPHEFETYLKFSWQPYADVRRFQLDELAEFVHAKIDHRHSTVITGDFNINALGRDRTEYHKMMGMLQRELGSVSDTMADHTYQHQATFPTATPGVPDSKRDRGQCLDYIFHLPGKKSQGAMGVRSVQREAFCSDDLTPLSDHYGVCTTWTH